MKRALSVWIAFILSVALLAGCAKPGDAKKLPDLAAKYANGERAETATPTQAQPTQAPPTQAPPTADTPAERPDASFNEFTALLAKNTPPAELISFVREKGADFSSEQARQAADELLIRIDRYYDEHVNLFYSMQEVSLDLYDLTDVSYGYANRVQDEPIDAAEKKTLNELIDNGLMFYFAEGLVLDIDAAGFLSLFPEGLECAAADTMRIAFAEQQKPSMLEGMTEIGEQEMIARCETALNCLQTYPDSPFAADVKHYLVSYYRSILVQYFGLFDYDSGKVRAEAKPQLLAYAAAAKGTKVEPVIAEFLTLLEKEGWKQTDAVNKYLISLGFASEEVYHD